MGRRRTGIIDDPDFRRERARMGGAARTSPDYHITKLTEAAASLTDAQRARLSALLAVLPGVTA